MKTNREIAEMHYPNEANNKSDEEYRQNRIACLESLLDEQLRLRGVLKPLKDKEAIPFVDFLKLFEERVLNNETFYETKNGLKPIEDIEQMYEVYVINL